MPAIAIKHDDGPMNRLRLESAAASV